MKKMEKLFNWISIAFGMAGGFLTYWLGGMGCAAKDDRVFSDCGLHNRMD